MNSIAARPTDFATRHGRLPRRRKGVAGDGNCVSGPENGGAVLWFAVGQLIEHKAEAGDIFEIVLVPS